MAPPLAGIRVVELSEGFAIPYACRLLADMGAEVIKIESWMRPDSNRTWPVPENKRGPEFWNEGALNHDANRGKYIFGLHLDSPESKQVFTKLVERSDIIAENYTPRVMKNFGFDYEQLREIKRDIIMISSTGFGHSGPWTNYSSFGMTLEPTAGLSNLTGYPDGPPIRTQFGTALDMSAGSVGAFAMLAALRHRRRTGRGQWIDLAQYEIGAQLIAPSVMDFTMNGVIQTRIGNRHTSMAPHGVYPCRGKDVWLAIAVRNDDEFAALCLVMEKPELAEDDRFVDVIVRYDHQDELDTLISDWTRGRDRFELFHALQQAGVPAAPVQTNKDVLLDPHLRARDFFSMPEAFPRTKSVGRRPNTGPAYKLSKTPGEIRWMAPPMGEHNELILGEFLGYSEPEIAQFAASGIIGKAPPPERLLQSSPELTLDDFVELGVLSGYDTNYREILGLEPAPEETDAES